MKLVIVIDGKSAEALFAVGPKDLMDFFLPKYLLVEKDDIKKCFFEEIQQNGKSITMHEAMLNGRNYEIVTHKDNYVKGN